MENPDEEVSWDEISESSGDFLLFGKKKRIGRIVRVKKGKILHIHYHQKCYTLGSSFENVEENILVQTDKCADVLFGNIQIRWPVERFATPVQLREAGENRLETAWPHQGNGCPCCLNRPDAPPPPSVQGKHLIFKGTRFQVGSFVLVESHIFPEIASRLPQPVKEKRESTEEYPERWRSLGTTEVEAKRPLAVAKILKIVANPPRLRLQHFCRPEDIDPTLKSAEQKVILITKQEIVLEVKLTTQLEKCSVLPTMNPNCWADLKWVNNGPLRFLVDLSRSHNIPEDELSEILEDCRKSSKEAVDWSEMIGSTEKLTLLDIFSGAGGLSKGLEMAGGIEVKVAIDNDGEAAQAFRGNFPNCTVLQDDAFSILQNLEEGDLNLEDVKALSGVDMVCAGSPCQGFSKLNRHLATENANNQRAMYLVPIHFFIKLKAKYLLTENVETAMSSVQGKTCVSMLVSKGYQVAIEALHCIEYGLPQTRKRFFLIAAAPEVTLPKFPASTHSSDRKSGAYRPTTVLEAIGDLNPKGNSYSADQPLSSFQCQMRPTAQSMIMDHTVVLPDGVNEIRFSVIPEGGNWTLLPNKELKSDYGVETTKLTYELSKSLGRFLVEDEGVGKHSQSTIPYRIACTAGEENQWRECYRRASRHSQVKTISASSISPAAKQALPIHYEENRLLTLREVARLQSLPDDFNLFGQTFSGKMKQIGNAVPSLVAFMIGIEFAKANSRLNHEYEFY